MTEYSADELRRDLRTLNLDSSDFAVLTGATRSTVWRWSTGRTPVPAYARTIIRQAFQIRTLVARINEAA